MFSHLTLFQMPHQRPTKHGFCRCFSISTRDLQGSPVIMAAVGTSESSTSVNAGSLCETQRLSFDVRKTARRQASDNQPGSSLLLCAKCNDTETGGLAASTSRETGLVALAQPGHEQVQEQAARWRLHPSRMPAPAAINFKSCTADGHPSLLLRDSSSRVCHPTAVKYSTGGQLSVPQDWPMAWTNGTAAPNRPGCPSTSP